MASLALLLLGITAAVAAAGPIVVTGSEAGGGPEVRVFDAATGALLASFFAFDPGFLGGVRVGAVDANGDGVPDITVAAGPGGAPHVRVFDGAALLAGQIVEITGYLAYDPGLLAGVFVAGGTPTPAPDGVGITGVIAGAGLTGGGTAGTVAVGLQPCAAGQVLKATGPGAWACAPDANGGGTVTSVDSGAGLTGGPITGAGTLAVDTTAIQARVTGTCPAGQYVQAVNAAGGVTCGVDANAGGTVTSVGSGAGLLGGPITGAGALAVDTAAIQARVTGTCPAGQYVQAIDETGTVSCGLDANAGGTITEVVAGTGLSGGGTTGAVSLAVNPATVQARVSGGCGPAGAIQTVNGDGTVGCAAQVGFDPLLVATLRWDQLPPRYGDFPVGVAPENVAFDGVSIWVTNSGSNTVTKLNASDGAVQGTFPVGNLPQGLAFDGANIWVANRSSNTVTKLRASDGAGQGTFPTDTSPYGVAFDGANIWVANISSNTVTKLRASDGAGQGTFPVGAGPIGLAFDGANIWVANFNANTVTKLRASDGAGLGTFPVGAGPAWVAFDGASIWVACNGPDAVTRLRASDGAALETILVGSGPIGVAFDGTHIWTANRNANSVSKR
jgi:outer membrane lipoprotein-sorting protein